MTSTTRHLLTSRQLDALRDAAISGMTTPVTIKHTEMVADSSPYGDDVISVVSTVSVHGWLYSNPTPTREIDSGTVVTYNTYRLFLPVGTDISPGDLVEIGGHAFTVSDTTTESTWNPVLTATLRRRE